MSESEISKKISDVISLLQLLESVSGRFADFRSDDQNSFSGGIPWAGIRITLSSAKRILEEALDLDNRGRACVEAREVRKEVSFSDDFYANTIDDGNVGVEYGFAPPASLAGRIRQIPNDVGLSDLLERDSPLIFEDRLMMGNADSAETQRHPEAGLHEGRLPRFRDGNFLDKEVFKIRQITSSETSLEEVHKNRDVQTKDVSGIRDSNLAPGKVENPIDKTHIVRT